MSDMKFQLTHRMMFSNKVVKASDKDERSPWMKTGLIYEELNKINLQKQL